MKNSVTRAPERPPPPRRNRARDRRVSDRRSRWRDRTAARSFHRRRSRAQKARRGRDRRENETARGSTARQAWRTTRTALMPPKAKELEIAASIRCGRASLGTALMGQLGSNSRKLIVGGAICERNASIVIASSSPPLAPSAWPWIGFVDETGTSRP